MNPGYKVSSIVKKFIFKFSPLYSFGVFNSLLHAQIELKTPYSATIDHHILTLYIQFTFLSVLFATLSLLPFSAFHFQLKR